MNIALAVMGVVLTLWVLYAFRKPLRKSVVPALVWLANKLGALPVKASLWCWKRRWSIVYTTAPWMLFAFAVTLPVAVLFPESFRIVRLMDVHIAIRAIFALVLFVPCWRKVEPSEDGSPKIEGVSFLGLPWRSITCGLRFLFRPMGIPFEKIFKDASVKRVPGSFVMDVETKNRDSQSVKIVFGWTIHRRWFISYLKTDDAKRFEALKDWISSIVTVVVHEMCLNREEVYAKAKSSPGQKSIGQHVTAEFRAKTIGGMTLPEYFGVDIDAIDLADVDLPEEIRKAEQAKEVAQEVAKGKTIEMRNVKKRAESLVKLGVDPNEALKAVDIRDGKRTSAINENKISFDPVLVSAFGGAVAAIVEKFAGKKSKSSYKKKL